MLPDLPPFAAPSAASTLAFVVIVGAVAAAVPAAVWLAWRRVGEGATAGRAAGVAGVGMALWLALSYGAAASGFMAQPGFPPRLILFFAVSLGAAVAVALSPVGRRLAELPLAALVGFQAFRLPLELVLHSWVAQGSIPGQMTWTGHNLDIVTGVAAVVGAAVLARRPSHAVAAGFAVLGSALLLLVMVVAVRSTPLINGYPDQPPLLVAYHAPYNWIVSVCVAGALLGQVVLFRAVGRPQKTAVGRSGGRAV